MELLSFVRNSPNPNRSNDFRDIFWKYANQARHIKIAVGYIGASAVLAIKEYLELNDDVYLDLFVGMQYLEGFTPGQLEALFKLQQVGQQTGRGRILVSKRVKNHSKIYLFKPADHADFIHSTAYVGSANLETITKDYNRTFEAGFLVSDTDCQIEAHYDSDIVPLGCEINFKELEPRLRDHSPLESFEEAHQIDNNVLEDILSSKPGYTFRIPLKDEPKSHLNVYHGKPRENKKTGRRLARPWYEVEVMPGKAITQLPGYPQHMQFAVVTDDGWTFECQTHGDNSKNLRSSENLQIMGAWLKGRLETFGCLAMGEKVTKETFRQYGRSDFDMTYFPEHKVWYFDFSKNK